MASLQAARALALALPEATEEEHHGMPSFRVRGRIFATVPDDAHVRVMVDEPGVRAAVAANPGVCEPFTWGRRLACVVVDIHRASPRLLEELLAEAWARKAPRRLVQDVEGL